MIASPRSETEALAIYHRYWDSYAKGKLEEFASTLDEEFEMIGTSEAEICHSKAEGVVFLQSQMEEVGGKTELRNRAISTKVLNGIVLIHESCDLFIYGEPEWRFYSKVRLSTLLRETDAGWKVLQQHGSLPDTRVEEGETLAIDRIARENLELKDAVKRRTAELETKSRELEIEAALERVRARTMAMRHSEELKEVAGLLFQQIRDLGIQAWTTGFNVWSDDGNSYTDYVTNPAGEFMEPYVVDTTKYPVLVGIRNAKNSGLDFLVHYEEGEELKNTYLLLSQFSEEYKKILSDGFLFPAAQYEHFVFGDKVSLLFITYEAVPEAHDIFRRFGKVFEQTYTRFLDLQKAEAQAREAQIEAALEKVRSRSLAMHKTDELSDVVRVVFERLKELGLAFDVAGIQLYREGSKDISQWVAALDLISVPVPACLPFVEEDFEASEIIRDYWGAKETGKGFLNKHFSLEEKNRFFEYAWRHNDTTTMPLDVREFQRRSPGYTQSLTAKKNSALWVDSYSGQTISTHDFQILQRMAGVFEQAYIRFLDLQKAETQARETQIEAALERIRSKAMAMRGTEDLNALIYNLFEEATQLDFVLDRCLVQIVDPKTLDSTWILSNPETPGVPTSHQVPFHQYNPYLKYLEAWRQRLERSSFILEGEEKKTWDRFLFSQTDLAKLPEPAKEGMQAIERIILNTSFSNFGSITLSSFEPISEAQFDVLIRFTKVFELTYTRYFDLKAAEANAREAIRRASIERVRGEIASMRTTADLERITPLLWNELTELGIPFIRCGVFIMDEENHEVSAFLSTPLGKAIAAFDLDYRASNLLEVVAHWRRHQNYVIRWTDKDFGELADLLFGRSKSRERTKYMKTIPAEGLHLHYVPFLQGMLYVGHTEELSKEDLAQVRSLADAFSVAYARYEDFARLEATKIQVEKALQELKETQTQLIQQEKLASLGQLTAGIAHEIKNPLNFVTNFSDVSLEMIGEIFQEREKKEEERDEGLIGEILLDVRSNLQKVYEHGKRADDIVKSMLQHSRGGSGKKSPMDVNAVVKEFVNLAYHGMRAGKNPINVEIHLDLDERVGEIPMITEDFSRVIINICNNAFDAMREKLLRTEEARAKKQYGGSEKIPDGSRGQEPKYEPRLAVSTGSETGKISISFEDNGTGIPVEIRDQIMQPFFTTKKGTEGTGLGLSITHDIIKAHGGEIAIETQEGKGTKFTILIA